MRGRVELIPFVSQLLPFSSYRYKVSVTDGLYNFMHSLWLKEIAIKELD